MKKKLLALAVVLAMVAAMIVPMAVSAAGPYPSFANLGGVNCWYTVTVVPYAFYASGNPLTMTDANGTDSASIVNGKVHLVSAANNGEEAGIGLYVDGSLTLSQLANISISGTTPYAANIWLDTSGDGQFWQFNSSGEVTALNGDTYANIGNSDGSGNLSFTSTTPINYTLGGTSLTGTTVAQLAAGTAIAGVNGATKVALWIGNGDLPAGETTDITAISVNSTPISLTSTSSNVTGTLVTLNSIAITPVGPLTLQVVNNQTQQFDAKGTYSDNSVVDITSQVTWNSSAPTYASITSGGLVTPLASGATNITATLSGKTSNIVVVNAIGSPNTLTLNVPASLLLGTFTPGQWSKSDWELTNSSGTPTTPNNCGTVTETAGTDGSSTSWTVNAKSSDATDPGYMTTGSNGSGTRLTDPLIISPTNDASWSCADGSSPGTIAADGTPFSGMYTVHGSANASFDMWAAQYVTSSDVAGTYGNTITFTVGFTP